MRISSHRSLVAAVLVAAVAAVACSSGGAAGSKPASKVAATDTNVVPNALPYRLTFNRVTWSGPTLPALHSYVWGSVGGTWLVFGGRRGQGLHRFGQTGENFIRDSTNTYIWVINPRAQTVDSFPVKSLPATVWPALASTNQNFYQDPATNLLYTTGGYGWKADSSDMKTFGQMTTVSVIQAEALILAKRATPPVMSVLFKTTNDPRFAVTGGALFNLNGVFYLPFGQLFNGQYRPFGTGSPSDSANTHFTQVYTNAIAQFTLVPNAVPPKVNSFTSLTTSDTTQPFHRRDGNFINDIDPATGRSRIAGFGGVFPPGIIGAFSNAVYVDQTGVVVDTSLHQRFSQYEAPVISAWDSAGKAVYHTFYGGISGTFYYQTHIQDSVFKYVTTQGRNDGLPFVADISTLVHDTTGYHEWILPYPTTPDTLLLGASAAFIPDDSVVAAGVFTANGHVRLNALPAGATVRLGWIFGGIQAVNPLPVFPSTGTAATNIVQEVWITNLPSGAIPSSKGTSAKPPNKPYDHHNPPDDRGSRRP